MPYPYQIATGNDQPSLPYGGKLVVRGTKLYQFQYTFVSGTNWVISAQMSNDAGLTWNEVDSSGRPSISRVPIYDIMTQHDTGSLVVFAYGRDTAYPPTEYGFIPFDPSAGTDGEWGTEITGGPAPVDASTTSAPNTKAQAAVIRRGNGDTVLIHSDVFNYLGTPCLKQRFSVYASGAWGAAADLLITGTTENYDFLDYTLLGAVLLANDRIRVFAWTSAAFAGQGIATIDIEADNSLTNYQRIDGIPNPNQGGRLQVMGMPTLVTRCGTSFTALPVSLPTNVNSLSGTWQFPGLMLMEDRTAPAAAEFVFFPDMIRFQYSWISCSVTYDASTDTIYCAWTKIASGGNCDIRYSCFAGKGWATPATLFSTTYAVQGTTQTLEIVASGGTMRAVFFDGGSPNGYSWYWQAAATCSAGACTGTPAAAGMRVWAT
jgi:hypothetical protein